MRTTILGTLFLLGLVPLAQSQATKPVDQKLDRSQATSMEALPGPFGGGKLAEATLPRVEVNFIEPTMAYAPGMVEIRGRNLQLVREVRVAGEVVPVVFKNENRLVITPGNQIPGFGNLELFSLRGKVEAKIEFTPSLSAQWLGGRARLMLHPDAAGWYIIQYSFRRLDTPVFAPDTYYGSLLDETTCNTLCSGVTLDHGAMVFPWMRAPTWAGPSAIGPMHVQALCLIGSELSYSNLVTLQPRL